VGTLPIYGDCLMLHASALLRRRLLRTAAACCRLKPILYAILMVFCCPIEGASKLALSEGFAFNKKHAALGETVAVPVGPSLLHRLMCEAFFLNHSEPENHYLRTRSDIKEWKGDICLTPHRHAFMCTSVITYFTENTYENTHNPFRKYSSSIAKAS
jgi:hypothetical protein